MTEDIYHKLFTGKDPEDTPEGNLLLLETSMSVSERELKTTFILRLICAVAVRLSLVASVWVFIYDIDLWYGIPIFASLAFIFGGIRDRDLGK